MPFGLTPLAQTWRNAGWVFTTVTPLPLALTHPLHMSATVRGGTQEMARCTATKREVPST